MESTEYHNHNPNKIAFQFVLITFVLIGFYLSTLSGAYRVDDEHILSARVQSLALRGEFSETQVAGNQRVQDLIAIGEAAATQIEPLQTLLSAPLYHLGIFTGSGGVQILFLITMVATALSAGVIFLTALALGAAPWTAVSSGLLFGLGSIAWPYAGTFYRDPLAMLFCALAFLGLAHLSSGRSRSKVAWAILITAAVAAVLTKNISAVLLLAILLAGVVSITKRTRPIRFVLSAKHLLILVLFVILIMLWLQLPAEGPLARFSPYYYSFLGRFFRDSMQWQLLPAFLGPFFSPAKSIFLFSPLLVLAIPAMWGMLRARHIFGLTTFFFTLFIALAQGLFYRENWAGSFGWGLRYMLLILPPWFALLAKTWQDAANSRKWFLLLIPLSLLIQLAGAIAGWNDVYRAWIAQGLQPYAASAAWDVRVLAIPAQLKLLFQLETWNVLWLRLLSMGSSIAWLLPVCAVSTAVVSAFLLWRSFVRDFRTPFGKQLGITSSLMLLIGSGLLFITLSQQDPYWCRDCHEFAQAQATIAAELRSDDVIVVDGYGTSLWRFWMNQWDQEQQWYSLPYVILSPSPDATPLELQTRTLFSGLPFEYERLWYVTSPAIPDYAAQREILWLTSHYRLLETYEYVGVVGCELYLFALE